MKKLITILLILITSFSFSQVKTVKVNGNGSGGTVTTVTASAPLSITGTPTIAPNVVADTSAGTSTALVNQRQLGAKLDTSSYDWVRSGSNVYIKNITDKVGIGISSPPDVLTVVNQSGAMGVSIKGSVAGSVPTLTFLDTAGINAGSISSFGVNGAVARGVIIKTPDSTGKIGGTDNWVTNRFFGAANKISFGDNGFTSFIQTGHKLEIKTNRTTSTGGDTTVAPDVVFSSGRVGIGTGKTDPLASSLVEMKSTTAGLLIPRMTTTERNAITSPATGLLIWNTTDTTLNQYRGLSGWYSIGVGNWTIASGKTGTLNNSLTLAGTDGTEMTFPDTSQIIGIKPTVITTGADDTTTLVAPKLIPGFTFWGRANKKYRLIITLRVSCDNTGGIKVGIYGPAGAAINVAAQQIATATVSATAQLNIMAGINALSPAFCRGVVSGGSYFGVAEVTMSSTAGAVYVQYGSNTGGQKSTIHLGSSYDVTPTQ
jgi:hypothetical protein